ncbi:hypothetical protein BCT15_11460 [Vibrio splendidus]|nr:hypothetical protein BCT15_11460 [Vibrio splendidus]
MSLKENIAIERYKYILSKLLFLDDAIYKNMSSFSKIFISIITAQGVAIFTNLKTGSKIVTDTLEVITLIAPYLLLILCIFYLCLTLSNLFSWFNYRDEEVELLEKLNIDLGRKRPSWNSWYRWSETWFIIFMVCTILIVNFRYDYIISAITTNI